jgi:hypothetical protein
MKKIIFFILINILLVRCSETIIDQNNNGKITGKLYFINEVGEYYNPKKYAEVQIYDTNNTIFYTANPNAEGKFLIDNIKYGEYLINAKSENFVGYPDVYITAGGPEASLVQLTLYEVPSNTISIDSLQINKSDEYLLPNDVIMYFHFNEPINYIGSFTKVFIALGDTPDSTSIFNELNFNNEVQYLIEINKGPQQCILSYLRSPYYQSYKYLQAYLINPSSYTRYGITKYLTNIPVLGQGSNIVFFNK